MVLTFGLTKEPSKLHVYLRMHKINYFRQHLLNMVVIHIRYTPGQKFAYWEHLGCKLRVEIGAQEMAQSCCTLAVSSVAGQVAKRIQGLPWDGHELIKQIQMHGQFKWLRI